MFDYSNYMLRPFDKKSIEELEKFDEFKFKIKDKAKIIDYMIIMYDHNNSALRRLYPDYFTRKRMAAEFAGFNIAEDGMFEQHVEEVLVGLNDDFNAALIRFLMMFGLPDYPALVALKELQAQELKAAFSPSDAKDRKVIMANIEKLTTDISVIEDRLFTGMETENVRKAIYRYMETQRLSLQPEMKAKEIKEGRLTVKDPYYGKGK